jgi:3-phosphoshikimate 1-carboxyvinyltransferase
MKVIEKLPRSKSHALRYLILAAQINRPVIINNISNSSDVLTLICVFKKLGLAIVSKGDSIVVKNSFPECEVKTNDTIVLETGDGGAPNRFIIPLLLKGQNRYQLRPKGRVLNRPWGAFQEFYRKQNANISFNKCIEVKGPLKLNENENEIDCAKSSQFYSSLLLSYPQKINTFKPVNLNSSFGYVDITKSIIQEALNKKEDGIIEFNNPIDMSGIVYPLSYAFCEKIPVHIKELISIDWTQPDSYFFKILDQLDITYKINESGLYLNDFNYSNKKLKIDCNICPDLILPLVYFLSRLKINVEFINTKILTYKESNRLEWVIHMLNNYNINYIFNEDTLVIYECNTRTYKQLDVFNSKDHRVLMTNYLFSKKKTINNFYIDKSFPNFYELSVFH